MMRNRVSNSSLAGPPTANVIDGENVFLKTIIQVVRNRNDCEVREMTKKKGKIKFDAYDLFNR